MQAGNARRCSPSLDDTSTSKPAALRLPVSDIRFPFTWVSVSIDSRQPARQFSTAACWYRNTGIPSTLTVNSACDVTRSTLPVASRSTVNRWVPMRLSSRYTPNRYCWACALSGSNSNNMATQALCMSVLLRDAGFDSSDRPAENRNAPVHTLGAVPEILVETDPARVVEAQLGHADRTRLGAPVRKRHAHAPAQIEIDAADHGIVEIDLDARAAAGKAFEVALQRGAVFGHEQRIAEIHRIAVQRGHAGGDVRLFDRGEEVDETLRRSARNRRCCHAIERLLIAFGIAWFRTARAGAQ